MGYTLQNMRDNIRNSLDVDTTDIPDSLLDVWVREGWQRVVRRLRRWPFLEKTSTFNTVAATANYLYATIGSNVDSVQKITGPDRDLNYIPIEQAERMYPRNTSSVGRPLYWTRWAKGLTLWPTPTAIESMQFRYYEAPIEWVSTGAAGTPSQLPDEFHDAILQWALMRAHAQQEDLDLSQAQKSTFDEILETIKRTYEHEPQAQLVVFGGSDPMNNWAYDDRLMYPFE